MTKRFFLIPALLACVSALFAANAEVDILIRGTPDMVKLEKGASATLDVFNPGWVKPEERPTVLAVRGKTPLSPEWGEFSFSFTPSKDGKISITLGGKDVRVKKGEKKPEIFTVYDDFKVTGATLANPEFEALDDHGNFIGWKSNVELRALDTDRGLSARVWTGGRLEQTVTVKAGQPVTVAFSARADAKAPEGPATEKAAEKAVEKAAEKAAAAATPPARSPKLPADENEGVWPANWTPLDEKVDYAKALRIEADTTPDSSAALQARLDKGERVLTLPAGITRVTRLVLPENATLRGEPEAMLLLDSAGKPEQPIIEIAGNNVTLEKLGIRIHPRTLLENLTGKRFSLIKGNGVKNFRISELNYENSPEHYRLMRTSAEAVFADRPSPLSRIKLYRWPLVELVNCTDIEVSGSYFKNFCSVIQATQCTRVSFHDNVGINGLHNAMRFYNGSDYFLFFNNHFSHVKHPMVWDGGDCSPHNEALKPSGPEAASTVVRTMKLGDPDYASHMTGTYEVICYGNYGEYGKTLAWGRKGRRVIVTGNSARYTYDLAFDAEGCEEVIFSNNLSMNSKAGAFGVFYSNSGTSITGNLVVTEPKGHEIYQGQFARLHSAHGVSSKRTIISGNLFINKLAEPRFLRVDLTNDLLITGNSFINGGIKTSRYAVGGSVTVLGNSFVSDLANTEAPVQAERGLAGFTFSHNNLIYRGRDSGTVPALELNLAPVKEEERAGEALFRQIDGNTFRGWAVPVKVSGKGQESMPVVFFNNLHQGKPDFSDWLKKLKVANNLELD